MIVTIVLIAVGVASVFSQSATAQRPGAGPLNAPLDARMVLESIDRGVAYLKREQDEKGRWDESDNYPGGVSALCSLSLLNAGVPADDPVIEKSLDYLRQMNIADGDKQTYCVSLKIMVLCAATPRRDRETIKNEVEWLERAQSKQGARSGAWGYSQRREGGDPSNAQFAVLALHEAEQAGIGVKVDPEVWKRAAEYWRKIQNDDGSWSYFNRGPALGSMTCAGVGALTIASQAASAGDARVINGKIRCCLPHEDDDAIERGVAWLGRNFSVRRNPAKGQEASAWHYYYLYGLERVGRLTARRFIGEHDWYREGTAYLVNAQDSLSHRWRGSNAVETNPHIATAMALLFLSKGRRPVLMAKLKHESWDAHRNDVAHLTRFTEKQWELDLTWQQIDPSAATVDDLMQAPVLYISGSNAARLTPHAKKLRGYVDRGGFLFAEACCGDSKNFRAAFEALIAVMFPEPEYGLRQLSPPPNHPLWRMERLVRPESPYIGKLWGVEYGCRTCVVYCDADLSCYWELNRPTQIENYPAEVRQRIDDANTIGINVLAYATNREPRGKEESLADVPPVEGIDPSQRRGVIEIAKLRHGGGCDDAPGALANLTRTAGQGEAKMRIATDTPLIAISDPSLFRYHISFMHGRHDFQLSPAERKQLREYLTNGGIVLADSICASEAFTKAFRRELLASLPGERLVKIPDDDPLFTDTYGGYDIRQVTLRDPEPANGDGPIEGRERKTPPQLEGIRLGDRWAVIFSPYDLSCALEKHVAVECRGYSQKDAAKIGLNVLLYSLNL